MIRQIAVLDHGYVLLNDEDGVMGSDLKIVRKARQSYDAAWRAGIDHASDEKLINYLMKNQHTSPFEHVVFTFDICLPIFVCRQWHRHRVWSFSEVSARYTELPEEFYVPAPEQITTQSASNKQMRTDEVNPYAPGARAVIEQTCKEAFARYRLLLKMGVPRELARGVLPMNTYTRMSGTVNLHNLFRFLTLRLHEHAQYEIRVYAQAILELIEPIVPVSVEAFKKHVLSRKRRRDDVIKEALRELETPVDAGVGE